jgi:signal transduction histidine kinase
MDYHHVVEAVGVVIVGLVFYSYACRWFERPDGPDARWRPAVTGLGFGALSIVLMISRIQIGDGVFIDARAVPIALVALFEGWPAGLVAAAVAAAYRWSLGGSGAVAGTVGIVGTAVVGILVWRWARREGRVGLHHATALGAAVFVVTFLSFLLLGRRGLTMFGTFWFPFLVMTLPGLVVVARLFIDVADSRAAEVARREAAELRAVTLLARAAAHEINNPLSVVVGGLQLAARRVPAGSDEARWVQEALGGAQRIQAIVAEMNRVTAIREVPPQGLLPPMLDIRKSAGSP